MDGKKHHLESLRSSNLGLGCSLLSWLSIVLPLEKYSFSKSLPDAELVEKIQARAGVSEMHHSHQLQLFPDIIFPLHSGFHFPCWSRFLPPAHYLRQHLGRFHFHPLVYFFAYLSPALAAHQRAITRELRGNWGSCKRLPNMTDSLHVQLRCRHDNWCSGRCLCSPQSPSNLRNLTATRIAKSLASFQLPPILLPFFLPPCWAPKALCAERKKKEKEPPTSQKEADWQRSFSSIISSIWKHRQKHQLRFYKRK